MAAGRLGVSSLKEKEKTIGFPARLIYNYDDTYYLTASVRYEGNSKFGANHKWGWFPQPLRHGECQVCLLLKI